MTTLRQIAAVATVLASIAPAAAGPVFRFQALPTPSIGIPPSANPYSYPGSRPTVNVRPSAQVLHTNEDIGPNNCGPHAFESLSGSDRGACYGR